MGSSCSSSEGDNVSFDEPALLTCCGRLCFSEFVRFIVTFPYGERVKPAIDATGDVQVI
jgi:hypothetical protein